MRIFSKSVQVFGAAMLGLLLLFSVSAASAAQEDIDNDTSRNQALIAQNSASVIDGGLSQRTFKDARSSDHANSAPVYYNNSGSQLVRCKANCGFYELMDLIKRVIDFVLIIIAAPFAAIFFVYAGFLYLTSSGDPGKIASAKSIFVWIILGFIIVLSAWLVVNAILLGLGVKDAFNFLN